MAGPQGAIARRRPALSGRSVLTRTPKRPARRQKRCGGADGDERLLPAGAGGTRPHQRWAAQRSNPSPVHDRSKPGFNLILNSAKYVGLGERGVLRDVERVVAAFDGKQLGGGVQLGNDRL